jgi:predicted aminopeptidase
MSAESSVKLLKDKNTPEKVRNFLNLVQEIRAFAIDSIGLADNSNYTRLVEVESDYIVNNVTAADKLCFNQFKWCFPIIGCVPYKGYFERGDAEKEAARLAQKGYDVNIDEITGFSTLGFFSDPLYSFMTDYSVFSLASLIIHEQTHSTIYFKNRSQFNEELASFVGDEGAIAFVKVKYGADSEMYRKAVNTKKDYQVYDSIFRNLYDELDLMYKGPYSEAEKLLKKVQLIDNFKRMVENNYDTLFNNKSFKVISTLPINNASLAIRMTYQLELNVFNDFYHKNSDNLKVCVSFFKSLKKFKGDPKERLKKELQ